jgi:D-alanyl-lipoteichoic acid acyltransferase DltB (MBOAT superfamily)
MLFNSYAFIFIFLPGTLAAFFLAARLGSRPAIACLLLSSIGFYAWWNPVYVTLLISSILFNYVIGMALLNEQRKNAILSRKSVLVFGITSNLALLSYYKYANFFISNASPDLASTLGTAAIILPLGISFFTFTQIAFLVDCYRGEVRDYSLVNYGLFVTYFPHLIAGPVLHHKEIMPQFSRESTFTPSYANLATGLTIFSIGLFKKVVIADGVAPFSSPVFESVAAGNPVTFSDAWFAALAFHFQLYFDFSGYSDMAIGISWMFGVSLPLNFYSPYKALNIIEFWHHWHMTLSRFLRDYLYIPLGGNRKGTIRRYINLLLTMLLGGLWHGAGWTYVIWGALHGVALAINHAWHAVRQRLGQESLPSGRLGAWIARIATTVFVVVAWVFFRASDHHDAINMLESMAGMNGVDGSAINSGKALEKVVFIPVLSSLGIALDTVTIMCTMFAGLFLIVWALPNTSQLMSLSPVESKSPSPALLVVKPGIPTTGSYRLAIMTGAFLLISILGLISEAPSEFLYFQF